MTELYFRLGPMEGFTSNTIADKREGLNIPVRELMQNSLDATEDGTACNVEIAIEEIAIRDIPHIAEYEEILDLAIQTQQDLGSFNSQQRQIVKNLKSELKKPQIRVLMFADDGAGMDREGLNALIEQRSRDKSKDSGGSFGVGHLKAYDLSSLRYVLYATRREGKTLFTGVPILAGFDDGKQRGNIGRVLARMPKNESNPQFVYPKQIPYFMERMFGQRRQGTVVCIVGLPDRSSDDYETVIASHFFSALLHGRLSVLTRRDSDGGAASNLNGDEIDSVLAKAKHGQRPRTSRGEILSGQHTWQSFLAVKDAVAKEIELSSGDRVNAYFRTEGIGNSSVALIRSDMLVARHDTMLSPDFSDLRKSTEVAPFALVIDINQGQARNELFDLVKAAEGPHHNELRRAELSKEDHDRLRALLGELAGKVREHLPKIDRRGFDLPIFDSVTAVADENRKARPNPVVPPGPGPGPAPGPGSKPRPPTLGRPAEARIEAKSEETEEGWRVLVRITPTGDTQPRDSAYLSFGVAEDRDDGLIGNWLAPKNVLVDGKPGTVDDRVVPLGGLSRTSSLTLEATLTRPPYSTKGAMIAVLPVLSLKRETPAKAEERDQEQSRTT